MLHAESDPVFRKLWRSGGKDVKMKIDRFKLVELAPEPSKIKRMASKLLRGKSTCSVVEAIRAAKKKMQT